MKGFREGLMKDILDDDLLQQVELAIRCPCGEPE
jgi:hypothetical protein